MSDLISRRDAIVLVVNAARKADSKEARDLLMDLRKDLWNLPSARPQGRWLEARTEDPCYWICSECKRQVDTEENFCPNCGADMRGGDTK